MLKVDKSAIYLKQTKTLRALDRLRPLLEKAGLLAFIVFCGCTNPSADIGFDRIYKNASAAFELNISGDRVQDRRVLLGRFAGKSVSQLAEIFGDAQRRANGRWVVEWGHHKDRMDVAIGTVLKNGQNGYIVSIVLGEDLLVRDVEVREISMPLNTKGYLGLSNDGLL